MLVSKFSLIMNDPGSNKANRMFNTIKAMFQYLLWDEGDTSFTNHAASLFFGENPIKTSLFNKNCWSSYDLWDQRF